jgi:bacterioferritin-associated ferredoxin
MNDAASCRSGAVYPVALEQASLASRASCVTNAIGNRCLATAMLRRVKEVGSGCAWCREAAEATQKKAQPEGLR